MDQTIGKLVVPICIAKSSGRSNARDTHIPTKAPTKPSAIDTRQPPREKPVIACPSAPQIPATRSKIRRSNSVICLDYNRDFLLLSTRCSVEFKGACCAHQHWHNQLTFAVETITTYFEWGTTRSVAQKACEAGAGIKPGA